MSSPAFLPVTGTYSLMTDFAPSGANRDGYLTTPGLLRTSTVAVDTYTGQATGPFDGASSTWC